ncbi:MAG: hypothetical protein IH991_25170 [Planctomycetes bacterium]|nr:hypothetical protein [Planctomycetota bacterium]
MNENRCGLIRKLKAIGQWSAWFALLTMSLLGGCEGRTKQDPARRFRTETDQSEDTFIVEVMDTLNNPDHFNPVQVRSRVLDNLNRWLVRADLKDDWKRDVLVDQLPRRWVGRYRPLRGLATSRFVPTDVMHFQESVFARNIAQFAANATRGDRALGNFIQQARHNLGEEAREDFDVSDDRLVEAMKRLHPSLDEEGAGDLAVALRLFDWTVRNTQLEKLAPQPKADTTTLAPGEELNEEEQLKQVFPQYFQEGPGYQRSPLAVFRYGIADAWERSRVFILLARQAGLDVVMLARQDSESTKRPEPWVAAAYIQGQLFLFDAELGLPIPGPHGRGIATLAGIIDEPELLRALDIVEENNTRPYRISEKDQLEMAKRLLIDEDAEDQRWVMDWVAQALNPRELELLEDLVKRTDILAARAG